MEFRFTLSKGSGLKQWCCRISTKELFIAQVLVCLALDPAIAAKAPDGCKIPQDCNVLTLAAAEEVYSAKEAQVAEKDLRAKQKEHDWLQSQLDVLQQEMQDQLAKVEELHQAEAAAKEAEHSHGLLYRTYMKQDLAQATPKPGNPGASTWIRVATANRAAATLRAGTENLPPAGVEESAQPACKAAKHSHADTPHCAEQSPQPPAALQGSNETWPQREDHVASATDSGDESSSRGDSVSASEASHGTFRWSDLSNSDNPKLLPASDYTEDESSESDQETAAGDGTAALGTQQGSNLRKPVIPGKAAGDGIAAHGTQQGSELGMSVIPGDAARPQTCYRVAPKDIQSFYLGRHAYGDERDHAIANLDKLGHRLDAFPLLQTEPLPLGLAHHLLHWEKVDDMVICRDVKQRAAESVALLVMADQAEKEVCAKDKLLAAQRLPAWPHRAAIAKLVEDCQADGIRFKVVAEVHWAAAIRHIASVPEYGQLLEQKFRTWGRSWPREEVSEQHWAPVPSSSSPVTVYLRSELNNAEVSLLQGGLASSVLMLQN
ncbi:TPA: hypothetical protein ACH3X3_006980 [Trebouxia sp. C0006]